MTTHIDLNGKNILIGVTASIAIYKSLELIRLCIKSGANVRVVMSEEAKRFITPLTFEAISENSVLHAQTESWADDNNHIAIGKWADIFVIAPATANTLNKLSNGIADSLLTQTALAYSGLKLIAPAANTNMIKNPITEVSLKMLKLTNYQIISTQSKRLICQDEGDGALADVEDIFYATAKELLKEDFWTNRKVVVSGGGTVERIDDVRYISNFSSGKMANALALALYLKGADVCIVTSADTSILPSHIHVIDVESAEEMQEFLTDCIRVAKKGLMTQATLMDDSIPTTIQKTPYLFMAAAVSDYTPTYPQHGKLKKEMLGETWQIDMKKSVDILSSLHKEGIITIGFKAEMDKDHAFKNAKKMLEKKVIDAVCLNIIDEENPFGGERNTIRYITNENDVDLGTGSKLHIAFSIIEKAQEQEG